MSKQTTSDSELHSLRHSLAHITASAVQRLWPEAKFGVGPVVEDGFYYDIDLGDTHISEEDFARIETEMKKIIEADQAFEQFDQSIDEAILWAKDNNQPYKEELLNDLKRAGTTAAKDLDPEELGTITEGDSQVDRVSFYKNGDFTDLCRGPHVESTGKVGSAFKLTRVAGAYWRGDETKPQMQRLYGVAFKTQEELDQHLENLEEAKRRDHRALGKELDLFATSDLVGKGLPLFTPRGTVLRDKLTQMSQQLREDKGFQKVWIPHIGSRRLYETSGHWDKFGDELFLVKSQETSDELVLKPMNCPHHQQIYASQARSYRDLPLKYYETTTIYRDEKSGELHGLSRVRSVTQDDSHIFVTEEQAKEAVNELIEITTGFYENIHMSGLNIYLSFRDDSDAYLGDQSAWDRAQSLLEECVREANLEAQTDVGEAAFYGPKIDFKALDSLGREWQVATVQIDLVQPGRFELEYTDKDGSSKTPVMLHFALLGSLERFLSVYIEHTAGHFPFWLAPEQIRILTINESVQSYVDEIATTIRSTILEKPLKFNEIRFEIDNRNESLSKKIREAETQKVPLIFIVGPRDVEGRQVSVRNKDGESTIAFDELANFLQQQ